MNLYIKNMVCNRCMMVVKQTLDDLKLQPLHVSMGEAELAVQPTAKQLQDLNERLNGYGFELLDDVKQKQIEKIKSSLISKVQNGDIEENFGLSEFVSKALHKDYGHLSRLFSEVEGITIEHFFILQKIEKVKEWLVYNEMTISEISWKLGYSSPAHLSAQFRKITGMSPSELKKLRGGKRNSLDNVIHK